MASSSANVEGPPTAGVQVMEWLLDGAVPATGVFSLRPGALSAGAAMLMAGVGNNCGTAVVGGGVTSTSGAALFELLLAMLGNGGGPC
jgi:hypothetical protein